MASAALQSIRRRVTVEWPRMAEADGKALLLRTAREGHARIMREQSARAGVIPEWTAYANAPGNANLETVRLPGPIVYRYRYFREIVLAAIKALEAASPVGSGRYKRSHTLYVDGAPAPINAAIKAGQRVFIASPLPYARRLEIGKTESGRDFLVSVPNRIYERVAKNVLAPRYRNAARITFGYVDLPEAHVTTAGLRASYSLGGGRRRRRRQRAGATVKAPAIFIAGLS